ncbi:MAG TPA: nitrite/sulfite reductase [Microthrixaceae bacterium]|nr:nitrite/sulfite reductase [Microthrixaceae bacterium]
MAAPNIPVAKRSGLHVDLDRLTAEGHGWLSVDDGYRLKTYGVCPQSQDGVFMVRVRVPGGVLLSAQARGLARLARRYGPDWLHLTTRQSVELHWVQATRVQALLSAVDELGLSTRSSCGHTLRNVMCSEDAGLGLDEPFDCFPDARLASDTIVARSAHLNVVLPSRINMAFGGSPRCREDAPLNDVAFVSSVIESTEGPVAGYEVWAGGSLGKSPRLGVRVAEFIPRSHVMAAVEALIDVFVEHGDLERPTRGRFKFVLDALGADGLRAAWSTAFAAASDAGVTSVPSVEVLADVDRVAVLSQLPPGGWSSGVRPQRTPGRALVSIDVPLGDTCGSELELLADLADRYADGALVLSRDQDVVLRDVAVGDLPAIRAALAVRGLHLVGEGRRSRIRACTGATVCAVGITDAPGAGRELADRASLRRNPSLRVHVSGCPNSCAQHQVGDVGFSGSKVRVGGRTGDGYHVVLGAVVESGLVGETVGRVRDCDVGPVIDAVIGLWEATRHPGETMGVTVRRLGLDAVAAHLEAVMDDRWATGPEPDSAADIVPTPTPTPVTVAV